MSISAQTITALEYYLVDVFNDTALKGNQLAVVMNSAQLSTERMQAIAREFNLSETVFVERRDLRLEQAEGVRVRIFTTQEELQFAGHPTLGTASVLKLVAPELMQDGVLTLAENVGPIPVRFEGDALFSEMIQRDPDFGLELDRERVAGFCGLSPDDLDPEAPPQVVTTGTAFAIVMLRSLDALGRLRVDRGASTRWLREQGARWFYVMTPVAENGVKAFRARMQFNGGEDPATGSAAGCAVAYLVRRGLAPGGERFSIFQGIEIGRPSQIHVSAKMHAARVTDIRVGGSTVLVAKGTLFLP